MYISIINYGAGNLRSVEKALEKLNVNSQITTDKQVIKNSSGLILPGVGAFDSAILQLKKLNLVSLIVDEIQTGKPFLGLCLGMQLLFEESEEGKEKGIGLIKGKVKKFVFDQQQPRLKVPHMGWNNINVKNVSSPLLKNIPQNSKVYFVHSYYCVPENNEDILAETNYGFDFCSAVQKNNIFALQFHPEKSSYIGLQILKNFGELCK